MFVIHQPRFLILVDVEGVVVHSSDAGLHKSFIIRPFADLGISLELDPAYVVLLSKLWSSPLMVIQRFYAKAYPWNGLHLNVNLEG